MRQIESEVIDMKKDQIVHIDTDILGGTPVFKGTRVPVQTFIDYLKAGETIESFLDGFPSVSRLQAESFLQIALESTLDLNEGACCLMKIWIAGSSVFLIQN